MQIEMINPDRLIPYLRNARTHSADQISQIAASMAEFGFTNPILIGPDDVIIAGHGRLMAAKQLGIAEVPVIVLDHLSEAQRRALVLADNRLAESAGWDERLLAAELAALRDDGFDLDVMGFSEGEIEDLFNGLEDGTLGVGIGDGHAAGSGDEPPGGEDDGSGSPEPNASLAERFGLPPFSIMDARKGWWQDRKKAWLSLGIRSELGRGEDDRAAPGGSLMPGDGSRPGYKRGPAKAFNDGTALAAGGLADQLAAAATARKTAKK